MEFIENLDGAVIVSDSLGNIIYQAPWFHDGIFGGLVELSLEIPSEMPHFIRD